MRFLAAEVAMFVLLMQEVLGKVVFHSIPGNMTLASATAYENLVWENFETDEKQLLLDAWGNFGYILPLIPLWEVREGYDPCSDTGYDPSMMNATVEAWYAKYGPTGNYFSTRRTKRSGHQNSTTMNSTSMYAGNSKPWIALIDYNKYEACGSTPLHYLYPMYGVLSAQLLGASASLMVGRACPQCMANVMPPDVKIDQRTVKGVKITIPSLALDGKEYDRTIKTLLDSSSDGAAGEEKIQNSVALISFLPDPNFLAPIFEQYGGYRLTFFVLIPVVCVTVGLIFQYLATACREDRKKKRNDTAAHAAHYTRLCIVCPSLLDCLLISILLIDPFGNFHVFGYFTWRIVQSIQMYSKCFTDLIVVMYCIDVYHAFTASKKVKSNTPFAEKYKYGLPSLLGFGIFMVNTCNTSIPMVNA